MSLPSAPNQFSLDRTQARSERFHRLVLVALAVIFVFAFVGLVQTTFAILALPQAGLRIWQIILVSATGCLGMILLALLIAAGLDSLRDRLTPKPFSRQWLHER